MEIDFKSSPCTEKPLCNKVFGICDKEDGTKAYTDITDKNTWVAKVINNKQLKIAFTAIDNCICFFKEGLKDKESTCDGMLTFTNSLYLVELKNIRTAGWIPNAIKQLENTIKILEKNNQISKYKYKKAYACNKKSARFKVIDSEKKKRLFDKTGFRIDVQATISVK